MKAMQIESKVGTDGVLNLRVEMGAADATSPVLVTIEPLGRPLRAESDRAEWHRFVEETYGSCAGLGLERAPQPPLEEREVIE
jgi:hypothetical protein